MDNLHPSQKPNRFWGKLTVECPSAISAGDFRGENVVGAFSYFNEGTIVWNTTVGRFCSIAHRVVIGAPEHPVDWLSSHLFVFGDAGGPFGHGAQQLKDILGAESFEKDKLRTTIGNDVWIGLGAFIRKGLTIGNGAIVAANATVVRDVEPYSIVGGNPARVIRKRFADDICERIEKIGWWDYFLHKDKLKGIRYSDPSAALDVIERAIEDARIERLSPEVLEFKK
ncbi:MAG: CatB-related O-acetyltransferase [Azospirillaceae bacterium]|nr:CatB-related O-acetyltransferase [Azospirillaceae bacterium]